LDRIRELEEEKSKLSSEGQQMISTVSQLERKLKNLESFMISASLPSSASATGEKRTSVSRHSWAPGKGSRYDANAAPICLLPPELQEAASTAKPAWVDSSAVTAEEVDALREMADLLRQENEALRASASAGGFSVITTTSK
jgi:FtsZ-binding cell division protein ZapB